MKELVTELSEKDSKYGKIIELLDGGMTKKEILKELDLGKSQGYTDIKNAQKKARELYDAD